MISFIRSTLMRLLLALIGVMILLEVITVPLVIFFGDYQPLIGAMKNPLQGFLIGAVGTACIFLLINLGLKKFNLHLNGEKIIAFRSLFSLSFWGGLILFLLFLLQQVFTYFSANLIAIVYLVLLGLIPTFFTILLIALLYKYLSKAIPSLRIKLLGTQHYYYLLKAQAFYLALLVSVYEIIALPVIWLSFAQWDQAWLSGLLGGLCGSVVVLMVFTLFLKKKITFDFVKKDLPKQALLRPSGQQLYITENLSFSDYLIKTKNTIKRARLDLTIENSDKIITANTPFDFLPAGNSKKGILLVHGLFDSPFILKDLGQHFYKQGFHVRSVLLPGHGTVPGDLLHVNYEQWLETVKYGITSFKGTTDQLYVLGFSTGALLSIYMALTGFKFDGLILLSPALALRYKIINSLRFFPYLPKGLAQWLSVGENKDYARYESFAFNALYQYYLLAAKVKRLAKHTVLDTPIFMALGSDDRIIDVNTAINWLMKQTNPNNELLIYTHNPKKYKDILPHCIINSNIKNFSHVCLPISPENLHYGKQGDYENFLLENERYQKRKSYLSYNPEFENLLKELNQFFKNLSS